MAHRLFLNWRNPIRRSKKKIQIIKIKKTKTMKTFKTILTAVLFLTVSNGLMAQASSDEISATATVLASAEVNGVSDLEFGDVSIGTPETILPAELGSGQFTLRTNAAASITFEFPESLTVMVGGQTRNLPISFDGDYVKIDGKDNAGDNASVTYNPVNNETYSLSGGDFDHANEFAIYLGGIVTPDANQAAGVYSGTVTLSVEFN